MALSDVMDGDVAALADAVEDWKQTKYFLIRLLKDVHDSELDPETVREEVVDEHHRIDTALFELVLGLEDALEDRRD